MLSPMLVPGKYSILVEDVVARTGEKPRIYSTAPKLFSIL
jgi:hypothetical protein